MRWATVVLVATGALASAGCSALATRNQLQHLSQYSQGQLMPVHAADFPGGDPRQGARGSTTGSQLLAAAAQISEPVGDFVASHGLPDAVAVDPPPATTISLAYLAERRLYSFTLEDGVTTSWSRHDEPLTDAQIAQADPELRAAAMAKALGEMVDAYARVQRIGRALLLVVPAQGPPGASYGFLLLNATPATVKLWGGEPSNEEKIVAWVDPTGPQRDRLRIGDRVTAVNGKEPLVGEASGGRWEGARVASIRRGGESLEVAIEPETLPRAATFLVIPAEQPNAAAVEGQVGVTTGFLALFPDDDVLAVAIGHELAHITLGHVERKVTPGSVLKGIVGVGVLLPADIVLPGTGQLLGSAIQGVENRFNRDQERDADRVGLQYAKTAGYDPAAALVLIDTLQEKVPVGGVDQFLDIHPPYPERRTLIAAELERLR